MTHTRGRIAVLAGIAIAGALALAIGYGPIGGLFERGVSISLNAFAKSIASGTGLGGPRLFVTAFAGGLLASISPCILGLLPLNLSYIGASRVTSRTSAMLLATAFVGGVAVTTIAVGLAASLFFALFVTYCGQVNITVGALIVVMAFWMAGLLRLPVPNVVKQMPTGSGPFVIGLAYALVATPCASPVLVAVLGAAAASRSILTTLVAMTIYAIGYTAVLWLASVFAGVTVASRRLLQYGDLITRAGSLAMLLLGGGFVYYGFTQL